MPNPTEAITRKELIDPQLRAAGWDISNPNHVGLEIPVDNTDPQAWRALQKKLKSIREAGVSYDVDLPTGISDYALYRENGQILGIVEAKRASRDVRLAEAQAEFYVTEIEKRQGFRPFAFLANGYETYFWDVGRENKRLVPGFFSREDLETLLYLRQNGQRLSETPIENRITDRAYQHEAIRRACEAFDQGRRKVLLLMATGTGKTRVAMSLVDVLLRADQARRVLFVADRQALVEQALEEGFETFLPGEPCTRIFSQTVEASKSNRLFVVTLQTLSEIYRQFTPGFFNVVIFDEVHRSIFNKWKEPLEYFDARMIGLTATPARFIDRNTFLAFDCLDGTPTFAYDYQQAVAEGYLVPYSLYVARTRFQRQGIRGVDLSEEERNALIEQGQDPDEIDFSGSDLEVKVSNKGTLREQWHELLEVMLYDQSGQLPGKTIVFALTQAHAVRLREEFDRMYPDWPDVARVITYESEYKGTLLKSFKKEDKPRIAITVDLLETGVNVPEVVNLVIMKPVQSRIRLEQMIGRGTRGQDACKHLEWLPNGQKKEFLMIDFWENDFNRPADKEIAQSLPVLVTIFNTRLKLVEHYLPDQESDEAQRAIAHVREMIGRIPRDSYSVQRVWADVERAWTDSYWLHLTPDKVDFLRMRVGPLLRYAPEGDVQAATFTSKVERLKLQLATGIEATATVADIAADVSRLPDFVWQEPAPAAVAKLGNSPSRLRKATPAELDALIEALAGQMKKREKHDPLILDLPDVVEQRGYILLRGGAEPVYRTEYRRRVQERIAALAAGQPVVQALARGEVVADEQLLELERWLRHELGGAGVELSEETIWKAYELRVGSLLEFLRETLALPNVPDYREIVVRAFEQFITSHCFTADQIRFLKVLQNVFLEKRRVSLADLYDAPFSRMGQDVVERWFSELEITEILEFADSLSITDK